MVQPADVPSQSVEPARREEYAAIAELTVRVYVDGGLASADYAPELADVEGRASRSQVLVVRDADGRVVGSVALVLAGDFGNVIASDEEAAFRMLVVDTDVQGQGVGRLLVTACLDRARAAGKRRMVLSTDPRMTSAHRLYERLGFARRPERDWSPVPGVDLLVYALDLEVRQP